MLSKERISECLFIENNMELPSLHDIMQKIAEPGGSSFNIFATNFIFCFVIIYFFLFYSLCRKYLKKGKKWQPLHIRIVLLRKVEEWIGRNAVVARKTTKE